MRRFIALFAVVFIAGCCGGGTDTSDWDDITFEAWTPTPITGAGTENSPYELDCYTSASTLGRATGDVYWVKCPADCKWGAVWGTGTYTGDTNICPAAIHAGVLADTGGKTQVEVKPGQDSYEGSVSNGVTSSAWGTFASSMVFPDAKATKTTTTTEEVTAAEDRTPTPSVSHGKKGGTQRGGSSGNVARPKK